MDTDKLLMPLVVTNYFWLVFMSLFLCFLSTFVYISSWCDDDAKLQTSDNHVLKLLVNEAERAKLCYFSSLILVIPVSFRS